MKYVGRCAAEARTEAKQGKNIALLRRGRSAIARGVILQHRGRSFFDYTTRGVGVYHALRKAWRKNDSLTSDYAPRDGDYARRGLFERSS
ncbi:hypothetical protein L195_g060220 [Trifolium pratense]|uniref:Uncharacterized protein n=1 Tax=Trifolium pratense TaxID=57577 RepID=A0A2K3K2P6_TRIPR|nr:hypothetical protein L195_g060220 [Trifolium pratense]